MGSSFEIALSQLASPLVGMSGLGRFLAAWPEKLERIWQSGDPAGDPRSWVRLTKPWRGQRPNESRPPASWHSTTSVGRALRWATWGTSSRFWPAAPWVEPAPPRPCCVAGHASATALDLTATLEQHAGSADGYCSTLPDIHHPRAMLGSFCLARIWVNKGGCPCMRWRRENYCRAGLACLSSPSITRHS